MTIDERAKPPGAHPAATNKPALPNRFAQNPTALSSHAAAIIKTLNEYGQDGDAIAARLGVVVDASNDPLQRVPVTSVSALYDAAITATGDPYFGLAVAQQLRMGHMHALGFAMLASATLLDFCKRFARSCQLISQAVFIDVDETDHHVTLRGTIAPAVCGQAEQAFGGFLVLAMRKMLGYDFEPVRFEFRHAMPPGGDGPYVALLGCPVSFGHAGPTLVLARKDLVQPLAEACPDLATLHDAVILDYLRRLDSADIVSLARQKILELLPSGACNRRQLARSLCISETTLHDRLADAGTSFRALVDEIRCGLASTYLKQSSYSITEIAFMLGFTDAANFTRAFRRWSGASPSDFRGASFPRPATAQD